MNNKSYWFYIENYVHLFYKKADLVLYNSLSGDIIEYRDKAKILKFVKYLRSKRNFMSLKLTENYLNANPEILEFIQNVKNLYMGDLIDTSIVPIPPFIMVPFFNLMKNPSRLKKESTRSMGENILSYLKEISIYINSECNLNCSICNNAYKQFLFCHKKHPNKEIDILKLKDSFSNVDLNSLIKINILGGDIFKNSNLEEIVSMLKGISIPKVLHVHYKNIINGSKKIKIFKDELLSFKVLIDSPIDLKALEKVLKLSKNNTYNFFFIFPVMDELELESINNIIKNYELNNSLLVPYYNGENLSFFEKYVYIKSRKMIKDSKPTRKDIFTRMVLNTTNFGKIFIKNDGKIFANLNASHIGKLGVDTLHEVLYKEMLHGRSWMKLRTKVIPCKNCVFNLLCPPISNYEYVIGKNNLCNICR